MENITVTLSFNVSSLNASSQILSGLHATFILKAANNLALAFYTPDICKDYKNQQILFKALEVISFVTLLIALIPGKIIGLELFGVLQLAFFTLGNMD